MRKKINYLILIVLLLFVSGSQAKVIHRGFGGAPTAAGPTGFGLNPQQNNDNNVTSVTIASYAVPAGDNKILVCTTATEEGASQILVSDITHNSVSLTKRRDAEETDSSTYWIRAELWDLQLGSTTPTGDIVVTMAAETDRVAIFCHVGEGLAQQAPEATNEGNDVATSITTSVTTVTADAEIVDGVANHRPSSETIDPTEAGQTEVLEGGTSSNTGGTSERTATSTGAYDMGWDKDDSGLARWAHVVAAYEVSP